ncbi:DUF302 domain-containing protein [Christensenella tenuis]|jgi:uncharacterized protein (DUF302 family)|uniref:DUF302 domain-containing protein n=1 Tax=Christensenella tenuis TaxID=2763033 RepID=A0ABR7EFC1_9FIRM|nr:DUF302 domain-containing protein [Christensenella tenuis]MBC5648461.1 DUF302 domain-containing protein [Christensenella tenuis]
MTEIKKNGRLCIFPSAFDSKETVRRVERELEKRKIPVFAKFDHEKNAQEAGLLLRPTEVLVFGSPEAGTKLMQKNQSFAIELPLRMSIWEDEKGKVWLAFPRMSYIAETYNLAMDPVIDNMQALLEDVAKSAA